MFLVASLIKLKLKHAPSVFKTLLLSTVTYASPFPPTVTYCPWTESATGAVMGTFFGTRLA